MVQVISLSEYLFTIIRFQFMGDCKRSYTPSKQNKNDKAVETPMSEWDVHGKKLFSINARAMNILYYELKLKNVI